MKILIIGRSGVGKEFLAGELEKLGLSSVKSYTTRPKRTPDEDTHIFITPEEAAKYTGRVAPTVIDGYEYFASREQVEGNDIYIIDPIGAKELVASMPDTAFMVVHVTADMEKAREMAIGRAADKEYAAVVYESRTASEDAQFLEFENREGGSYFEGRAVALCQLFNPYDPGSMKNAASLICMKKQSYERMADIVRICAKAGIVRPDGENRVWLYMIGGGRKSLSYEEFAFEVLGSDEALARLMREFLQLPDAVCTDRDSLSCIHEDMPQQQRMELWGGLVEVVEDWLDSKGITVDDIPNDERPGSPDDAIIYGSDYDIIADGFADVIGISRDSKEIL